MNAPSSARSSKRSLRGRDTRQGTQFGRRGVGTGLGVSSAGDTNSWLWPASRASKSSKAIGPTGLFEGGAALKPARARAAMPKRGLWAQAFPVSLLPKRCLSRRRRARCPRRGLALPNDCELAAAPLSCRIGGSTGRCWTRPRPADSQPRARSAAKLMRRRLSRVEAPFILSWAIFLGCAGREPDECARDPGRRTAAPRRGGVVLARGRALIFCKARGFSSVRWRDLGAATNNLPKNPHPRRLHGRNGVVRASLLPGRRRAAKSVQVVLQRRSKGSRRLARLDLGRAARCAGEDRLLSSAPHGLKRPKSEAYIPEE